MTNRWDQVASWWFPLSWVALWTSDTSHRSEWRCFLLGRLQERGAVACCESPRGRDMSEEWRERLLYNFIDSLYQFQSLQHCVNKYKFESWWWRRRRMYTPAIKFCFLSQIRGKLKHSRFKILPLFLLPISPPRPYLYVPTLYPLRILTLMFLLSIPSTSLP